VEKSNVKKLKQDWFANVRAALARLPPSVTALLLQLLAFALAIFSLSITGLKIEPLLFALLCGLFASALSHFAGLARWWLLIQFLFTPALVVMLKFEIPSGVFLLAFLLMLLVYWSTFRSQVPLYLSSKRVWLTLEELLPPAQTDKQFTFMDIGSGIGGVLTHLSAARPDGHYYGVEIAPLPYFLSWLRIKLTKNSRCHVTWGSLWDCDFSQYDVVFAYLSPVPMEKLWHKVKQEMRPGTVFISNTFAVPEHPPQYSITLDDMHHSTLNIWHM
jgi:hypothetical protein